MARLYLNIYMKKPKRKFLTNTWVGWLNILILQWLFIRLAYVTDTEKPDWCGWKLQKGIVPLTGWWSDYIYI